MKKNKNTISEYSLKYTKSQIQKTKVTTSENASNVIRKFYFDDINIYESFFILLLNSQFNRPYYFVRKYLLFICR